jgi:hypothetical protein
MAFLGMIVGILLGLLSHFFDVKLLSTTDIIVHVVLAIIGATTGFIAGSKERLFSQNK